MKTRLENTIFTNMSEMKELKGKMLKLKNDKDIAKEVAIGRDDISASLTKIMNKDITKADKDAIKKRKKENRKKDKEVKRDYDKAVKKCKDKGKKLKSDNSTIIKVLGDIDRLGLE